MELYFRDTRNKKRKITIVSRDKNGCLARLKKTTYVETGMKLYFNEGFSGEYISVGELEPLEVPIILKKGDFLKLTLNSEVGKPSHHDAAGKLKSIAHIACTYHKLAENVEIGDPILFDDGKINGKILKIENDYLLIEITHLSNDTGKLRADKGINLPSGKISNYGLTEKDRRDLAFVVRHADVINMSFVNSPEDVKELLRNLKKLEAPPTLGIILKIETKQGYNQLKEILLTALRWPSTGVMIARGDLAVEVGWKHIGRVQQEILNICEGAHVPSVWATQVLENLAKKGMPSRAEITDAIKAQQADCIMLNKGKYISQSIKFLDQVLKDMEPYQEKSAKLTPAFEQIHKHEIL